MTPNRLPKTMLYVAILIRENVDSKIKYNWLMNFKDLFLIPIGEEGVLKNLDSLSDFSRKIELVNKYKTYI